MQAIANIQHKLKSIYGSYSRVINILAKFVLAFVAYLSIGKALYGISFLANPIVVLVLAILSAFIPINMILVASSALILAHLAKISLFIMAISALILVVLFILYYRFTPKLAAVVLLTPIAFILKIPFVIPIFVGIVSVPTGFIAPICGTIVYYMVSSVKGFHISTKSTSASTIMKQLSGFLRKILLNKEMALYIVLFIVICMIVYSIKRGEQRYAYEMAIVVGSLVAIVGVIVGKAILKLDISIGLSMLGTLIGAFIAYIAKIFIFNVDYKRIKKVQYEDDEYYYFVRIVPKVSAKRKYEDYNNDLNQEEDKYLD